MCFGSSWAIFIIFLINCFIVSFLVNFAKVNDLYAANYLSISIQCFVYLSIKKIFLFNQFSTTLSRKTNVYVNNHLTFIQFQIIMYYLLPKAILTALCMLLVIREHKSAIFKSSATMICLEVYQFLTLTYINLNFLHRISTLLQLF